MVQFAERGGGGWVRDCMALAPSSARGRVVTLFFEAGEKVEGPARNALHSDERKWQRRKGLARRR